MKILHISDIYNANGNGVVVALSYYLKYEKMYSDVGLYNLNSSFECDCDYIFNKREYSDIGLLPDGYNKPDLVIFNEVYKKEYINIYKYCLKNNIPYAIIPHGCLVSNAQKRKRIKKMIGNILLFNRFIKKASCIQFLNEEERIGTKFKYKDYIISGNGVDVFTSVNKYNEKVKKIVYIGRYAIYAKGLDFLVNVCKNNIEWFRNNKVIIELYGRTSANDQEILEQLINDNCIGDVIQIKGAAYGELKEKVLNNAYAFIQTSRHEGQPMGIMEAMAHGLPCIVTEGTNFSSFVNEYKCGIGVSTDEKEIFESIKKLCDNMELRDNCAANALEYSKKFFSCDEIAKDTISKYKNLINK